MEANRSDALRAYAECINAFYKEFGDLVKIHVVLQPYPLNVLIARAFRDNTSLG